MELYDEATKNDLLQNKKNKSGVTWLKKRMKDLLGSYAESNYDALGLIPHASVAMKRARRLDVNPKDRWPQTIGSRVYLLMESIIDKKN